jgi:hypothetical protein
MESLHEEPDRPLNAEKKPRKQKDCCPARGSMRGLSVVAMEETIYEK